MIELTIPFFYLSHFDTFLEGGSFILKFSTGNTTRSSRFLNVILKWRFAVLKLMQVSSSRLCASVRGGSIHVRALGARPVGPVDPLPPSVSPHGTDRAEVPSAPARFDFPVADIEPSERDAENNCTGARCLVFGLLLGELRSGLVSAQTRTSPNAAR